MKAIPRILFPGRGIDEAQPSEWTGILWPDQYVKPSGYSETHIHPELEFAVEMTSSALARRALGEFNLRFS